MPRLSPRRRALVRRRADGTFRTWPGGRDLADMPRRWRRSTAEGIATHIGAEFRRDRGRRARVGDIHRTRTMDGSYHRLAYWYVRTPRGWRVSPHGTRRPTPSEIKLICATARPGRPYRRRTPDPRRTPK